MSPFLRYLSMSLPFLGGRLRRRAGRHARLGLYLLGSFLEMDLRLLDALAATVSSVREPAARGDWETIGWAVATEGRRVSQACRDSRLLQPAALPVEAGEVTGNLPAALRLAAGCDFADACAPALTPSFAMSWGGPGCTRMGRLCCAPPRHADYWETFLHGPIPRMASALVAGAVERGWSGLDIFLAAPYNEWPPPLVTDRGDPLPREPEGWENPLPDFAPGRPFVGRLGDDGWTPLMSLEEFVVPAILRYVLFWAGIPYWTNVRRVGTWTARLRDSDPVAVDVTFSPSRSVQMVSLRIR